NLECLVAAKYVGHVTKVDARDELLGRHVGDEFPYGLALDFCVKVPNRIDYRRRGEMDCTLLRTDPSELAWVTEPVPESAQIGNYRFQRRAHHEMLQCAHRRDADLVAAPKGEGNSVAFERVARVGLQHYVSGGIVRVGMHGVRAGQRSRSRCSDVTDR